MAVILNTKKTVAAPAAKPAATPATKPVAQAAPAVKPVAKAVSPASKPAAAGPGLSFLKTGKAAQEQLAKEDLKQEQNSKGKTQRFWVPEDKEAQITFLDGDLVDGVLDIPFFYEHNINMNGKWGNFFICTQDTEPCPICEGSSNASYVGVLTVIDHGEFTSKKDGKVYKDQKRLFVAKRDTIKLLQKKAAKLGGLRGVTFDVSRTGDKSASVGNAFDFVERRTPEALVALYKEGGAPLDYNEVLAAMYLPAKDLRKLGFGSMSAPVGSEQGPTEGEDYSSSM